MKPDVEYDRMPITVISMLAHNRVDIRVSANEMAYSIELRS